MPFDPKPAIAQLENSLEVMKTNEPINRKMGKVLQAELEKKNANSFEGALKLLKKKKWWEGILNA